MPTSPALKATVTRRPTADPVDQAERLLQAEHHESVENAVTTAQEAPTATPEPAPIPKAKHALQGSFLSDNLNKPMVIFLVNGIRLTGKLKQYDQFTLLIEGQGGIPSLVFKHVIATITPASDAHREQRQPQQGGAYP